VTSCVGQDSSLDNLVLHCPPIAIRYVFGDGSVKKEYILLDDSEKSAVTLNVDLAQIQTIEHDHALRQIIESGDQVAERRLTRSTPAHKGDCLTWFNFDIDMAQHRVCCTWIDEAYVPKRYATGDGSLWHQPGTRTISHLARFRTPRFDNRR
jgi:hypothetical protein